MDIQQQRELVSYLLQYVTENKCYKMAEVLPNRTRHVTILLEDIFQMHNASAIIRSAECLGLQDIHYVQDKFRLKIAQGVAMGSADWMSMHSYSTIAHAYAALKKEGYRIIATTPHDSSCYLPELALDQKFVLVFGTENVGLSSFALDHADEYVKIPMYGFTQSYNVSVSAALCLYDAMSRLRVSSISWQLSEEDQIAVQLEWLRKIIRGAEAYEKIFLTKNN